ncbi:MAG: regulatory iron-sulfur-containing complex subunit RicT [Chloroflexi bacterium]|nr:regulatory iron-sulfur-containing complex subunit RicT [Chloroflexota bacterium]MCY3695986.1 regulatory iron-sulfur-containing complex subunit RicT [Chloroflexota bacterium]
MNQDSEPTGEPAESAPHGDAPTAETADDRVVIGIRTREAARIYHFSAPRGQVFVGDYVVVDRARGDQLARVVTVPDDDAPEKAVPRDVRPIVRLADAADRDRASAQAAKADEILQAMRSSAVRDNLGLYPVAVELNLAGDRGSAWFQAPDHVNFRPMLEDIEGRYDVSLQMQQANQRERAMLVDGYDICGLRLCCSSWMTDFPHVGIRVAKDQDLSLNPDSISGVCGRLLCCLTFEHEVYREMRGTLPRVGKRVSTPAGMGKVIKLNVLQQKVTIALDDHPQRVDVPAEEIGLAVRPEDAPNQALIDAERDQLAADERAAALRRAAAPAIDPSAPEAADASDDSTATDATSDAPKRRRRRRSRKPKTDARQVDQPSDADSSERPDDDDAGAGQRKRSRRRRRRNKAQVVNQDRGDADDRPDQDAPQLQRREGDARTSRRRRRSRQPVNRPDPREGGGDSAD